MPKHKRATKKGRSSKKHRKTGSNKNRNYGDNWYIWRQHLDETKEANPDLEFWEVLILASDTYDTVNHKPMISWADRPYADF